LEQVNNDRKEEVFMKPEKVRVGLVRDLWGYGVKVPMTIQYDEAIKQWVGLYRDDPKFREYVSSTASPLIRRPKLEF